jgi:hypothetical protein
MLFSLVSLAASLVFSPVPPERSFVTWMRTTNQFFTGRDYALRLSYWLTTLRYIEQHNSAPSSFTLSLNKFSAYSPAERAALLSRSYPLPAHREGQNRPHVLNSVTDHSWESSVSPVRSQPSGCCSDWAMVAVDAVESAWKISGRPLPSLSVQALLDCVSTCSGCKGGNVHYAYEWVLAHQNGYLAEEGHYVSGPGCRWSNVKDLKIRIRSTTQVFEGDEDDLANVVATFGPAAAAIDASRPSYMHYHEGVYDESDCSPLALNHAVLVVGYAKAYWIVKNSWGVEWGIEGYMHMARGKGNQCGIATMALVPIC